MIAQLFLPFLFFKVLVFNFLTLEHNSASHNIVGIIHESSCSTLVSRFEILSTTFSVGGQKCCFWLGLDLVFHQRGMKKWMTHLLWMREWMQMKKWMQHMMNLKKSIHDLLKVLEWETVNHTWGSHLMLLIRHVQTCRVLTDRHFSPAVGNIYDISGGKNMYIVLYNINCTCDRVCDMRVLYQWCIQRTLVLYSSYIW